MKVAQGVKKRRFLFGIVNIMYFHMLALAALFTLWDLQIGTGL
jgi:hypothetical protein